MHGDHHSMQKFAYVQMIGKKRLSATVGFLENLEMAIYGH